MNRLTEWIGDKEKAIPQMDLKNNGHDRCMRKLANLEDLQDAGELLKLPCVVGDTVFAIFGNEVKRQTVRGILWRDGKIWVQDGNGSNLGSLGETVFLTQSRAEKALERMKTVEGVRLIDADQLDNEIAGFFMEITGNPKPATVVSECRKSFRRIIDEQPTAYDIDKVVKQIESMKTECENLYDMYDPNYFIDKAIDIVRKGGAE